MSPQAPVIKTDLLDILARQSLRNSFQGLRYDSQRIPCIGSGRMLTFAGE
jgi:hypothetical protein